MLFINIYRVFVIKYIPPIIKLIKLKFMETQNIFRPQPHRYKIRLKMTID